MWKLIVREWQFFWWKRKQARMKQELKPSLPGNRIYELRRKR